MSGNWAIGSRVMATAPMMTMTMEITIATIGRRMKKEPMAHFPPAGAGLAAGAGAASCFGTMVMPSRSRWKPSTHHALAALQALLDDPLAADLLAGGHLPGLDLVARAHHHDRVGALELLHRALRHEDGALHHLRLGLHLAVEPGAERLLRIREGQVDAKRAGLGIDRAIDEEDLARVGVQRAVGEDQPGRLLRGARLAGVDGPREPEEVGLRDGDAGADGVDGGDGGEQRRLALPHQVAHLVLGLAGDPGDGGGDAGVGEVEPRPLEVGLGRLHLRGARLARRHRVVELGLAHGALGGERREALHVEVGLGEGGLAGGQGRLGLGERRDVLLVVDGEEQLPLLDRRAFRVVDGLEVALDARPDLDVLEAAQLRHQLEVERRVLRGHRDHRDLRRWRGGGSLLLGAGREGEAGEQGQGRGGAEREKGAAHGLPLGMRGESGPYTPARRRA